MRTILQLHNIARTYKTPAGNVEALKKTDLSIQPGDLIALTGPSGSGKTTLLNLCSLLETPTAGTIHFDDHPIDHATHRQTAELRSRKMGMVFQRFHLLTRRTVIENVLFRYRYIPRPPRDRRQRALDALERVGLSDIPDRTTRLLSAGEMQRVAIARALVETPLILFADEPTGNLDPENTQRIMQLFQDITTEGIAILLATHNLALLPHCTRHLTCRAGNITEQPAPRNNTPC